jgi:hypothetical protein
MLNMRIGIHQPNFFPWMGYFYKISLCDTFVFLDHVEYTKNSYTKRVKIHTPNDFQNEQYITVPLQKHSDFTSINSLQIADNIKWQKKISAQIYETYHKAPFYKQIEPLLTTFFKNPLEELSFSHFNIEIIKYISELLGLKPSWIQSSEIYNLHSATDINLAIASQLKANTYISGLGAKRYQDESIFTERSMKLEYSDYPKKFEDLEIPNHFFNKSILSYLAHYSLDELRNNLTFISQSP